MRWNSGTDDYGWRIWRWVGIWALTGAVTASGAVTNVTIVNFSFTPPVVGIQVNDQVKWTWNANFHSTTSSNGLWNSGVVNIGFNFPAVTFNAAGNYPYYCTLHVNPPLNMTGAVQVASANQLPQVGLAYPPAASVFAAPWTGTLQATNSDTDGTVATVDFFVDGLYRGTVSNPPSPALFTVTNLDAGDHTLSAAATDNLGATGTSASVPVSVVAPAPIQLSSPLRPSASSFQFDYTASPGLSYIVRRSENLPDWVPISTNAATASSVTFTDQTANGPFEAYSVQLQPNP